MERIGIVGTSLHETDLEGLERLRGRMGNPSDACRSSPSASDHLSRELADALGASELCLLATCNRVEVVYARASGHLPAEEDTRRAAEAFGLAAGDPLRASLRVFGGRTALRHLFRVAASLDSLVVGEDQIMAQVREAFARARALGLVGQLLAPTFEAAFQVGKQVRTETELCCRPVSVVSLAAHLLRDRLSAHDSAPRIALVGAGRTGALAASTLRSLGLPVSVVANRTVENARALAERHGAHAIGLERLCSGEERIDDLLSATGAPGHVLSARALVRLARRSPSGHPLQAVDLAMPRDLEPVRDERVVLTDLEDLRARAGENRALRAAAAGAAEAAIERKLELLANRGAMKRVDSTLTDLVDEGHETLERELERLGRGRLAHLAQTDREEVERWARTTFGRLSHPPLAALKRLARELPEARAEEGG